MLLMDKEMPQFLEKHMGSGNLILNQFSSTAKEIITNEIGAKKPRTV